MSPSLVVGDINCTINSSVGTLACITVHRSESTEFDSDQIYQASESCLGRVARLLPSAHTILTQPTDSPQGSDYEEQKLGSRI
jgi:hypothetical protein